MNLNLLNKSELQLTEVDSISIKYCKRIYHQYYIIYLTSPFMKKRKWIYNSKLYDNEVNF